MTEETEQITLEEYEARKKNPATMGLMAQATVSGIATVFDKDGKVKFKMNITNIDPEE